MEKEQVFQKPSVLIAGYGIVGKNLKQIALVGDTYDENSFVIQAATKDNKLTTEMMDSNLNRQAIEEMSLYQSKGKLYQIKKVNDLRNNTTSKVRLEESTTIASSA